VSEKAIHDHGRPIDWGNTSSDYAVYRPGYPASFYRRITALGIGEPGQRVLDLGTGTGNVGRALARLGCRVTGVDISKEQIAEAQRLAAEEGLTADFFVRTAPAPFLRLNECWHLADAS
jgi:2-polyprenyl-3-methyl-5-hydroxy-6-metoxy-1,4-benzoquinol methylase